MICADCGRTLEVLAREGSDSAGVVLVVGDRLLPLRCQGCARVVCHVCQSTSVNAGGGVTALSISLDCKKCGDRLVQVTRSVPEGTADALAAAGSAPTTGSAPTPATGRAAPPAEAAATGSAPTLGAAPAAGLAPASGAAAAPAASEAPGAAGPPVRRDVPPGWHAYSSKEDKVAAKRARREASRAYKEEYAAAQAPILAERRRHFDEMFRPKAPDTVPNFNYGCFGVVVAIGAAIAADAAGWESEWVAGVAVACLVLGAIATFAFPTAAPTPKG